jgi:hypothetical protein
MLIKGEHPGLPSEGKGEIQGNDSSKATTGVHVLDMNVIRNLRVLEFFVDLLFESIEEIFVYSALSSKGRAPRKNAYHELHQMKRERPEEGTTYMDVIPHETEPVRFSLAALG